MHRPIKTVNLLGNFSFGLIHYLCWFVNNVFYSTFFNVFYFFHKNAFFNVFYSWGQRFFYIYDTDIHVLTLDTHGCLTASLRNSYDVLCYCSWVVQTIIILERNCYPTAHLTEEVNKEVKGNELLSACSRHWLPECLYPWALRAH